MSNKLSNSRSEIFNPGPGSYNLPTSIKVQPSSSKQSQQKRFKPYESLAPGPGQYNMLSINTATTGPKALILSRTKQHKPETIPGPGSYQPDFNKIMKSQSGYHLPKGDRLSPTEKNKKLVPGPGSYETSKSTFLNEKNAVGFGPQRKINLSNENNVPGPGQYNTLNLNIILSNAPKPVFSKGNRSQSYNTLAPGRKFLSFIKAGAYKTTENFEGKTKKGFSISFRNNTGLVSQKAHLIPGPGAYLIDQIDKIKFKSSSFSMPKSPRLKIDEKQIRSIPGPQKYNIQLTAFQHKSFKMGSSSRKGLQNVTSAPGPGTYNLKELTEMPKFSMPKANKSWIKSSNVPGPGNYEPKIVTNTQYQSIAINKDDRKPFYDQKKHIPGPGEYTINEMLNKKSGYTLGNEKRTNLGESREKKPGPGEYNVGSRLKGEKGG